MKKYCPRVNALRYIEKLWTCTLKWLGSDNDNF